MEAGADSNISILFRWLDGDTPSTETPDRAASIEIQQVFGMDPSAVSASPAITRHR